ncbi:hypothetical protein V1264_016724 [Littorina saxatilis]|uniref:SWIM-type domain-containing protein n=1 Tax=Littorina saxatilis TaxID=31220 RepID=A0AAN9BL80_9CAEN
MAVPHPFPKPFPTVHSDAEYMKMFTQLIWDQEATTMLAGFGTVLHLRDRVREIKYHPVRTTSANCYLSASVYPSMSTWKPCKVWVMVSKKGETTVGGEIQAAYCTCAAGLLGSCIHVAGLLFRVEAAVTGGVTQKSATEMSCQWIIPKGPVCL